MLSHVLYARNHVSIGCFFVKSVKWEFMFNTVPSLALQRRWYAFNCHLHDDVKQCRHSWVLCETRTPVPSRHMRARTYQIELERQNAPGWLSTKWKAHSLATFGMFPWHLQRQIDNIPIGVILMLWKTNAEWVHRPNQLHRKQEQQSPNLHPSNCARQQFPPAKWSIFFTRIRVDLDAILWIKSAHMALLCTRTSIYGFFSHVAAITEIVPLNI